MIEYLLDAEGGVNIAAIDNYIELNGIDTPYVGSNEAYQQQTLLFAAVSSQDIPEGTKNELVIYLLQKKADINGWSSNEKGGLIAVALSQNNTNLANLLLKNGASIYFSYEDKSILDIVLETRNEAVILWFLEQSKIFLEDLDLKTAANLFAALKNNHAGNLKIHSLIKRLETDYVAEKQQEILSKFSQLGLIGKDITALIIAAEMHKKKRSNTIFVIGDDDLPTLIQEIKQFLETETVEDRTKFQIIYFPYTHAIFGEFIIDKTSSKPKVTYIHCDPLPATIAYDEIIGNDFVEEISPLASIEVIDSDVTIQKGLGCSYFSIDGALMLTTPEDRSYVPDLALHMKQHRKEAFRPFEDKDVIYYKSSSLSVRFLLGLQYLDDEKVGIRYVIGLNNFVFNTKDRETIVNKKAETAEKAIAPDIIERPSKTEKEKMVMMNLRAERKMQNYGKSVNTFLHIFSIADPKTIDLIDGCKINGLIMFFDAKKAKLSFNNK